MMNIPVLITGTLVIIAFSWFLSIKHKRYHGIARLFSFESIFILTLLNYRVWFRDPFSATQIISWILLFSSIYFAFAGYLLLKEIGKPKGGNFENTTIIVRTGLYRYIRHPLYMSLLILGTGVMMKDPRTLQLCLGALNLFAIWLTARIEENEMIARFGEDYRKYMKETKMFIPFLF
jgi:protein-S-isoprenylcysteine O-methyltransferase Ste14